MKMWHHCAVSNLLAFLMRQASSDIWPPQSQFPFSERPLPQNVPEGSKDLLLQCPRLDPTHTGRERSLVGSWWPQTATIRGFPPFSSADVTAPQKKLCPHCSLCIRKQCMLFVNKKTTTEKMKIGIFLFTALYKKHWNIFCNTKTNHRNKCFKTQTKKNKWQTCCPGHSLTVTH